MAALGREDIEAFVAGRLTLDDLAGKASVSRQAASRWTRRRGIGRKGAAPFPPDPAASPSPAPAGTGSPISASAPADLHPALIDFAPTDEQLRAILVGALIASAARANLLLSGKETLGASGLKAAVVSLKDTAELLHRMGAIKLADPDTESLTKLTVGRLTETEEQELRDAKEADAPDDLVTAETQDA